MLTPVIEAGNQLLMKS